ncbi:MAG: hypothetical protein ABTQ27_01830 [Amaricoccus sp.]|uniref:hypothetical protein n=1 Tax=Amaricoccus sp. TaxID=1872485 RepID=UPI003315EE3C
MLTPDHLDADLARDPETAFECVQIAPMGGDLCAILFMLSDPAYERTLSLVFTARDFAPESVERILKTQEWLMSLTCPAREELFALEATTRVWHYRNRIWNREKVAEESMRRVWGGDGTQPLLVGRNGLAYRYEGAWLPIPPASTTQFFDAHGAGPRLVYACGDRGHLQRLENNLWRVIDLGRHDQLRGLDVAPDGTVRLAGSNGVCLEIRGEVELIEIAAPTTTFFTVRGYAGDWYWGDETQVYIQRGAVLEPFFDTGFAFDLRTDGRYLYCVGTDRAWRFGHDTGWSSLRLIYDGAFRLI